MTKFDRAFIILGIGGALAVALGWRAPSPAPAAAETVRIASVDMLLLVERMISGEKYTADRDNFTADQNKKLKPLADELQKIRDDSKDLKEESDRFKALAREYNEKNQKFMELGQAANIDVESFKTAQVAEAFRILGEAVQSLAANQGYTHVVSTRSGNFVIKSNNVNGAVQEILARPLISSPAADDLTEKVIAELKLEPLPAPPVAAPVDPAPANK
jgi:Skp family chaperone for outer membrane proteins